jgi:hypothetical protein
VADNKRIVFNTSTPNDQGGIITNDTIDFTRYNPNPVILCEHMWSAPPLGIMTDIKVIDGKYTGIPVFHRKTQASIEYADMYEAGALKACSIGGFAEWKTNGAGQPLLDKDGNRTCVRFDLYEISMCSLPSNKDAVTLSAADQQKSCAMVFDSNSINLTGIYDTITTLSSQFKNSTVETTTPNPTPEQLASEKKVKDAELVLANAKKEKEEADKLAANNLPPDLPPVIKDAINGSGMSVSMFNAMAQFVTGIFKAGKGDNTPLPKAGKESSAPAPQDQDPITIKLNEQIALKAKAKEAAKSKMDDAKEAASKALDKAKKSKADADKEDATDEMKAQAKADHEAATKAVEMAEKCEAEYEAASKEEDSADKNSATAPTTAAAAGAPDKVTASATPGNDANNNKPTLMSSEKMREELKLAAPPQQSNRARFTGNNLTFTKLHAAWVKDNTSNEGKIYERVMSSNTGSTKEIADYSVVLNSIMNDDRYKAVREKARFNMNVGPQEMPAMAANPKLRGGISMEQLAAKLANGSVTVLGSDNVLREQTTLSSTDNLLASPDLFAVEWLPLFIFQLFPDTSWKADIPVFSAQETGNNTGLIWANVAADPQIFRGAQPNNPTPYSYNDTAVSLSLTPYWLNPMLWTPMTMHQLRYDQQSTGWAQAFAKWGAIMDDNLIYTLASTVPANSVVATSGNQFNITGQGANVFYYNPTFTGSLLGPAYNDIFAIEQIYNNQNYDLKNSKPTLVIDPIMERFIKQDPDTKSLLTRFVKSDESEVLKIGNTILTERSRGVIYDPATSQVKDPNSTIPATAIGAALGFIPGNVGIGLGMLDVFFQQSPGNYGYIMSADTRIGIVPLRANFNGTSLFTYSQGNV